MNVDNGNIKIVESIIYDDVEGLTWSHDMGKIAYIRRESKKKGDEHDLWVVDLDSGMSKKIISNIGKIIGWAKDNKTLFYEYGQIYSISVKGGEPKQITKEGAIAKSYRNPVLFLK